MQQLIGKEEFLISWGMEKPLTCIVAGELADDYKQVT